MEQHASSKQENNRLTHGHMGEMIKENTNDNNMLIFEKEYRVLSCY